MSVLRMIAEHIRQVLNNGNSPSSNRTWPIRWVSYPTDLTIIVGHMKEYLLHLNGTKLRISYLNHLTHDIFNQHVDLDNPESIDIIDKFIGVVKPCSRLS